MTARAARAAGAALCGILLAVAAPLGLVACRVTPGCSGARNTLCMQIDLDPGLGLDHLQIKVQRPGGTEVKAELDPPADARPVYAESDLSGVPDGDLTVLVRGTRGGALVAGLATTVPRAAAAQPVSLRLTATGPDGGDPFAPMDAAPDLIPPPDLSPPQWRSGTAAGWTLGKAALFEEPVDLCWTGGRLYVSDAGFHRVLAFAGLSFTAADAALDPVASIGAPLASPSTAVPGSASATNMAAPRGISCAEGVGYLLVADSYNNRVLYFENNPATGAAANAVAGQGDFTSRGRNRGGGATPAAGSLSEPYDVFYAAPLSQLYIVDRGNHRVVVYPATLGQLGNLSNVSASAVLGQPGLTSGVAGSGSTGLSAPEGVFVDLTRSRVAAVDTGNRRVLLYNTPTVGSQAADAVIGQSTLTEVMEPSMPDDRRIAWPAAVTALGGTAYVVDRSYHRVLVFPGLPGMGAPWPAAYAALGQQDLTRSGAGTDLLGFSAPQGALAIKRSEGTYLFVAERGNKRVAVHFLPARW